MPNVRILFLAQLLTGSGLTAVVLFGGILSAELSPDPSWATLPVGAGDCIVRRSLTASNVER